MKTWLSDPAGTWMRKGRTHFPSEGRHKDIQHSVGKLTTAPYVSPENYPDITNDSGGRGKGVL